MSKLLDEIKSLHHTANQKMHLNFLLKNLLAFGGIYCISAIIAEGFIIFGFYIQGYHLLNGEIPKGLFFEKALPLYGYGVFFINTILFVKICKKKSLSSIGLYFNLKALLHFVKGGVNEFRSFITHFYSHVYA